MFIWLKVSKCLNMLGSVTANCWIVVSMLVPYASWKIYWMASFIAVFGLILKKIRGICKCGEIKNCSNSSLLAAYVLLQMSLTGMLKGTVSSSVLDPSTKSVVTSLYGMLWKEVCWGSSLNLMMGEFAISMPCSFKTLCSGNMSAMLSNSWSGA